MDLEELRTKLAEKKAEAEVIITPEGEEEFEEDDSEMATDLASALSLLEHCLSFAERVALINEETELSVLVSEITLLASKARIALIPEVQRFLDQFILEGD